MIYVTKIEFGTPQYDAIVRLRQELLRTPLGLEFEIDDLLPELHQYILGCYNKVDTLLGCALIHSIIEKGIKIGKVRQVCVSPKCQGYGLGKYLMGEVEKMILDEIGDTVVLAARKQVVPFYQSLGYHIVGEEFIEVTIPHFKMKRKLVL